jgi:hypothetical protein
MLALNFRFLEKSIFCPSETLHAEEKKKCTNSYVGLYEQSTKEPGKFQPAQRFSIHGMTKNYHLQENIHHHTWSGP